MLQMNSRSPWEPLKHLKTAGPGSFLKLSQFLFSEEEHDAENEFREVIIVGAAHDFQVVVLFLLVLLVQVEWKWGGSKAVEPSSSGSSGGPLSLSSQWRHEQNAAEVSSFEAGRLDFRDPIFFSPLAPSAANYLRENFCYALADDSSESREKNWRDR